MRYELSDSEWSAVRVMLPNTPRGVARADDRRVLNGIFYCGRVRRGAIFRPFMGPVRPATIGSSVGGAQESGQAL
jgi:transposase